MSLNNFNQFLLIYVSLSLADMFYYLFAWWTYIRLINKKKKSVFNILNIKIYLENLNVLCVGSYTLSRDSIIGENS